MTRIFLATTAIALLLSAALIAQDRDDAKGSESVRITNGPVVEATGEKTATIAWSTNVNAGSTVLWGTAPGQLTHKAQKPWGGTSHRVEINDLPARTKIYFMVESEHAKGTGTSAKSTEQSFMTQGAGESHGAPVSGEEAGERGEKHEPVRITNGPVVEATGEKTATVAWSTNVDSSTTLRYGTAPARMDHAAQAPWGGTEHRVHIQNLKPGTTYYFMAESQQGRGTGTSAKSAQGTFTTQGSASTPMAKAKPAHHK